MAAALRAWTIFLLQLNEAIQEGSKIPHIVEKKYQQAGFRYRLIFWHQKGNKKGIEP